MRPRIFPCPLLSEHQLELLPLLQYDEYNSSPVSRRLLLYPIVIRRFLFSFSLVDLLKTLPPNFPLFSASSSPPFGSGESPKTYVKFHGLPSYAWKTSRNGPKLPVISNTRPKHGWYRDIRKGRCSGSGRGLREETQTPMRDNPCSGSGADVLQGHGQLNPIYDSVALACQKRGWDGIDILIICGDFQVRFHPFFFSGGAVFLIKYIIGRPQCCRPDRDVGPSQVSAIG